LAEYWISVEKEYPQLSAAAVMVLLHFGSTHLHGRRQGGARPPWIFKHGINIVNRGLKVLFFGLFFRWPPWKRLNSAIFWY